MISSGRTQARPVVRVGLAVALLLAACGPLRPFVRPQVGAHVVAVPPKPVVTSTGEARGQFMGSGFHADVTVGVSYSRLDFGLGLRAYTGMDYEGRCSTVLGVGDCTGYPFTPDALWILAADFPVVAVRILPWKVDPARARRLALLGTLRFGVVVDRANVAMMPGFSTNEEWDTRILVPSAALGLAARYSLSRHLALEVAADASWFFFDLYIGHLVIVGIKAGPALRF